MAEEQSALLEAITAFGSELKVKLLDHLKQRQPVVERWVKDMYQYRNQYSTSINTGKSKVFVGYTRAKTDAWTAQMTDMLFPSDDKFRQRLCLAFLIWQNKLITAIRKCPLKLIMLVRLCNKRKSERRRWKN